MIYVRVRGASKAKKVIEDRQVFIRLKNVGEAVEFFTEAGFELKSHTTGIIFVARNMAMRVKLGSNAEIRFPPQDWLVADVIDHVDPENVSFKRDRRSRSAKTG